MTDRQRVRRYAGTAYEVGYASGQELGEKLERNIAQYLRERPDDAEAVDWHRLRAGALSWLRQLPQRFQQEYEGLAVGSGLTLMRVAEWAFLDAYLESGCSGFVGVHDGHVWLGRNNDMFVPSMWGYAVIREISGRIPTISMSLEGCIFSPSGINRDQLWIHHQYMPVSDAPRSTKPHVASYVFVTEALETCSTIQEVENLLNQLDRDDGMLLMVVDGKSDESAVFECTCQQTRKRKPVDGRLACTNHALLFSEPPPQARSVARYRHLEELMEAQNWDDIALPEDLIRILADDGIERREDDFATVYSVVVCPALRALWTTLGGFPAASHGNWQTIAWPWETSAGEGY